MLDRVKLPRPADPQVEMRLPHKSKKCVGTKTPQSDIDLRHVLSSSLAYMPFSQFGMAIGDVEEPFGASNRRRLLRGRSNKLC